MNCPVCNVELAISDRQGIEIDYCPKCRGVWLDRGELDKLIERSVSEVAPPSRDVRVERGGYRDDSYYKKHKRRGLLGDIFDFD